MNLFVRFLIRGIVVSLIIDAVLAGLNVAFAGHQMAFFTLYVRGLAATSMFAIPLTMANSYYFYFVNSKVKWRKFAGYRILISAAGSIVLTMLLIFLIRMLRYVWLDNGTIGDFIGGERFSYYIVSLGFTLVISLFFHAFYFYKRLQENRIREQKVIAGAASAQFESLKNQIDPHFLFNSLNVLSSLIEENPDNAQKFTGSLSKVYRYVLEQKDKELVPVSEELAFAKTYLGLLKMRFEDSLICSLPDKFPEEGKVVPLSLQLLLENTIKHNVVSQSRPLHIRIFFDNDCLVVENGLQKKEALGDRQGVGLQNIASRYAILTDRKVLCEENAETFSVRIPVLTRQIEKMGSPDFTQQASFLEAQKKMEDIKGFYGNLIAYIVFTVGLATLNLLTSPEYLWFLYPAVGWGFGVAVHGMAVYNAVPFLGRDWEERKIRQIMEREKQQKWN